MSEGKRDREEPPSHRNPWWVCFRSQPKVTFMSLPVNKCWLFANQCPGFYGFRNKWDWSHVCLSTPSLHLLSSFLKASWFDVALGTQGLQWRPFFSGLLMSCFSMLRNLTPSVTLLDLMMDIQYLVLTKSAKKEHINEWTSLSIWQTLKLKVPILFVHRTSVLKKFIVQNTRSI